MPHISCQLAIFSAAVIYTSFLSTHGQSIEIAPMIRDKCPSDDDRQSVFKIYQDVINQISFGESISTNCGPGYWRRVLYLNAGRQDQSCLGDWNLVTSPVRACTGIENTCRSAFSDDINSVAYSKVCGRIIGEGRTSPDAFFRHILGQTTIEDNYLDGVSITHGASGSRTHIWSLGAGHSAALSYRNISRCPCDNSDRYHAPLPPAEVGDDYFCDRADGFDPLWTGESCMNDNPCCSFHNPPYFSVQLPAVTTDSIELRICNDQNVGDETILVLFAEIYVQ